MRSTAVEDALRAVPRESFAPPGLSPEATYADEPILLKRDADGRIVSTISQPTMIATMLEQLAPSSGAHVLEVGTASGYNAALLAEMVGGAGSVISLEIEPDLAEAARRTLDELGVRNVEVHCTDGREGFAESAPFDGVIITAGAERVEPAWTAQLRDEGRLVVPVAPNGSGTCFTYEKRRGRLVEIDRTPCGFVPLRDHPISP